MPRETVKVYDAYDRPDGRGIDCSKDVVLTKQSFKEECDINVLVERYGIKGPGDAVEPPMFGDFASAPDFLEAQLVVAEATQAFAALDAKVRERFANDPARYLEFVGDPKNTEEAIELGMAKARPPEIVVPPQQVVVGTLDADGKFVPQAPASAAVKSS